MTTPKTLIAETQLWLDGEGPAPDVSSLVEEKSLYLPTGVLYELRDEYISRFGFTLLSQELVEKLATYSPLVEIGCGTGALSEATKDAGTSARGKPPLVTPTDIGERNTSSRYGFIYGAHSNSYISLGAREAVSRFPSYNVLLSWPSYDESWAAELLPHISSTLLYIGEGPGGCTADDAFHEELARNWTLIETFDFPRWEYINDRLTIWEKHR